MSSPSKRFAGKQVREDQVTCRPADPEGVLRQAIGVVGVVGGVVAVVKGLSSAAAALVPEERDLLARLGGLLVHVPDDHEIEEQDAQADPDRARDESRDRGSPAAWSIGRMTDCPHEQVKIRAPRTEVD
jgi:hypothetical protein